MKRMALISALLVALTPLHAPALKIGEKAPPLKAAQWINGGAVDPSQPDGKTSYVVEFWATWCGPCRQTAPHLNKLHDQYKDRGILIVGVTDESEETVRPFLAKMSTAYLIACDTNRETHEAYMEGVPGIPHAFVVDTNGIVVWSGHPMDGLDEVLSNVVAGTYVIDTNANARAEAAQELQALFMEGDFAAALAKLDELINQDPSDFGYYQMKLAVLAQMQELGKMKAVYADILSAFDDSADTLNTLAWLACTSPFPLCDLPVAWKAAQRAAELSNREVPAVLDTLARVHYALGALDEAVAVQAEAVAKAAADEKEDLQKVLDYYRSAAALRSEIAGAAKDASP